MKKCPTCGKTFDDNLKFCQTDGTALVEDAPPLDPYQTVNVNPEDIGAPLPIEPITPSTKAQNVDNIVLEIPDDDEDFGRVKSDDPLKTMVSSGSPSDDDDNMMKTAIVSEAERKEIFGEKPETSAPPPSPFDENRAESSSDALPPSKFNEPDLSPPNFDDFGSLSPKPPREEKTPPPTFEPTESPSVTPNTPIPSPFDESMPPGYQTPSTPPFKEAEATFNDTPFGSPFNEPAPENRQMQQQAEWTPPATDMPSQPYNQSPTDGSGQNQTLAIVSLILGIVSFLCLGYFAGIPAIITGVMARKKSSENPAQYGGSTLAMVGIILGAIGTLFGIAGTIFYIYVLRNGGGF